MKAPFTEIRDRGDQMTREDLNRLQRYIGKRPRGQTDQQVMERLEKIDRKTPLTPAEWEQLLLPVCANGDVSMLRLLLGRIGRLADPKPYILHTVRFRRSGPEEERRQAEVLEALLAHAEGPGRADILNEALVFAAWFGAYEAAKLLVAAGADVGYTRDGKSLPDSAQNAVDKFGDRRVRDFLAGPA